MPRWTAALALTALLTLSAAPAPAQDVPNPLAANWQALQTAVGNFRNSVALLANENAALQQQAQAQNDRIKMIEEKCGAPCKETPPPSTPK